MVLCWFSWSAQEKRFIILTFQIMGGRSGFWSGPDFAGTVRGSEFFTYFQFVEKKFPRRFGFFGPEPVPKPGPTNLGPKIRSTYRYPDWSGRPCSWFWTLDGPDQWWGIFGKSLKKSWTYFPSYFGYFWNYRILLWLCNWIYAGLLTRLFTVRVIRTHREDACHLICNHFCSRTQWSFLVVDWVFLHWLLYSLGHFFDHRNCSIDFRHVINHES